MAIPGLGDFTRALIFPGCPVALPDAAALARAYPGVELLRYETRDGLGLVGALAKSHDPDAPVVLYFHGNAESVSQNLPFAQDLQRRGIDVCLVEYRGYASGPGSPSEIGLYLDATAALEALLATGVKSDRIVLCGRSLGSGVACEIAHRGHGRGLILISPFTSIVDMARRVVGPLAPMLISDRFDNVHKVPDLEIPVTVIHGTADPTVPYDQGAALGRAAKRGTLVTLEGADHIDMPDIEGLVERAVRACVGG